MSAAALALRESNQPVAEIAAKVGYENASKFSAAFKRFLGETPIRVPASEPVRDVTSCAPAALRLYSDSKADCEYPRFYLFGGT